MKIPAVAVLALWAAPVVAAPVAAPSAVAPTVAKSAAVAKLPEVTDIIEKEGQFIFSDNSSFYVFKKDGTFKLFPLGLSGRIIDGTWKADALLFEIQGVWGWDNGMSQLDDHRKMVLGVHPRGTFKAVDHLPWSAENKPVKIYDCYFEMEELVKMPQAEGAKPSDK